MGISNLRVSPGARTYSSRERKLAPSVSFSLSYRAKKSEEANSPSFLSWNTRTTIGDGRPAESGFTSLLTMICACVGEGLGGFDEHAKSDRHDATRTKNGLMTHLPGCA